MVEARRGERRMPELEIAVRRMRPADIPAVMYIERRSFATPWAEHTFRSLLRRPSARLAVATHADRLVGYMVVWFAADEAELGDLAVLPEIRRRGVGARLLEAACAAARERGASSLFLEVRRSNRAARRLYTAAGFDSVGVRPGYYTLPTEDAVVMRRTLVEGEPDG